MSVEARTTSEVFGKSIGANVLVVTFRKPEKRNIIDPEVIAKVSEIFSNIPSDVRAVVLTGEGKVFCAGGDLRWMERMGQKPFEENYKDALALAKMYRTVARCPVPVLGHIRGGAWGGGVGFVAVCDIAITHESARFAMPEVKIGLVPAVISVFVRRRVGVGRARYLALTGKVITAREAERIGLVDEVVADDELDERFADVLRSVVEGGPKALSYTKKLFEDVSEEELERASLLIALARAGEEGQDGIKSFFEKRKPFWVKG